MQRLIPSIATPSRSKSLRNSRCHFGPFATQGPGPHFECGAEEEGGGAGDGEGAGEGGEEIETEPPLFTGMTGEVCFTAPPRELCFLGPPTALWAEAG
jgi:hypothetical protein